MCFEISEFCFKDNGLCLVVVVEQVNCWPICQSVVPQSLDIKLIGTIIDSLRPSSPERLCSRHLLFCTSLWWRIKP